MSEILAFGCLRYFDLSSQTVKALGAVIGNCEHLSRIDVLGDDDSICYLLEQVRSPSNCSVSIDSYLPPPVYGVHLTSVGAVQLASLLPRFNNVITLHLDLGDCCAAALDTLVTTITHKTLTKLDLRRINLTRAATKALGRALPEMSSLQQLTLTGFHGGVLQAEETEALFGGFSKAMPLCSITFSGFGVRSCLAPLVKCLSFFPDLRDLYLKRLDIDDHDQYSLLKSFGFLTTLQVFIDEDDFFHYYTSEHDKILKLGVTSLTPAVAAMLGRIYFLNCRPYKNSIYLGRTEPFWKLRKWKRCLADLAKQRLCTHLVALILA